MNRSDILEVERLLRSHELVENAVISSQGSSNGETVAYVTLHRPAVKQHIQSAADNGEGYESQHVDMWETIYSGAIYPTIEKDMQPEDIGRDFHGWVSAYDGSPLGNEAMGEWLDDTIGTILFCHGQGQGELDVLELGTGSGMILFNLAKHMRSYLGVELTQTAIDFVTATANSMSELANKVIVRQGTAADFNLYESSSANLVIINSVAQYFPSLDYLTQVVEQVLCLKSVRTIFFGDMRSSALIQEFFVSKALRNLPKGATKEEVSQKVAEMAQAELELLTDPAFFTGLLDRFRDLIEHVEILPKKMKATNELSCYRYAAVIHVADRERAVGQALRREIRDLRNEDWIDFQKQKLDYEALSQRLVAGSGVVAVSNIPYSKISFERHIVGSLQNEPKDDVIVGSDWLASVSEKSQELPSLSPVDLVALAQKSGHRVEISWARQHSQRGGLDAVFHRHRPSDGRERVLFKFPTDHQGRRMDELSSHPLEQQAKQEIQQVLYDLLEDQLPSAMMPDEIIIQDQLPVNGSSRDD